MSYKTILTSKGTTTIPAAIRRKLGIKPGMRVSFEPGNRPNEFVIKRALTIEEIRIVNNASLRRTSTNIKRYRSGAGFEAFVKEKYGTRRG